MCGEVRGGARSEDDDELCAPPYRSSLLDRALDEESSPSLPRDADLERANMCKRASAARWFAARLREGSDADLAFDDELVLDVLTAAAACVTVISCGF